MDHRTDFCMLMKFVLDSVRRHADQILKEKDLTMLQVYILMALYEVPTQTLPLKTLESIFHVSQPAIVGMSKRLKEKQLVEIMSNPEDRRVKLVRLKKDAVPLCQEAARSVSEVESTLTEDLTPEERKTLRDLLLRVADSAASYSH